MDRQTAACNGDIDWRWETNRQTDRQRDLDECELTSGARVAISGEHVEVTEHVVSDNLTHGRCLVVCRRQMWLNHQHTQRPRRLYTMYTITHTHTHSHTHMLMPMLSACARALVDQQFSTTQSDDDRLLAADLGYFAGLYRTAQFGWNLSCLLYIILAQILQRWCIH